MIIARAPLRVSFLGGGTDYQQYFENQEFGMVLGTAIDRFVYVMLDSQPSFEKSKFKFTYRYVEEVEAIENFKHPVMKGVLSNLKIKEPLNIATMANLPGRSGLGSSSAFTVALYAALLKHLGEEPDSEELAKLSVELERWHLSEPGGFQDQYHAAIGGFRSYKFEKGQTSFSQDLLTLEKRKYFESGLALVATNIARDSADFAFKQVESIGENRALKNLDTMRDICVEATEKIGEYNAVAAFNVLTEAVKESWLLKKNQIGEISSQAVEIMERAESLGAEAVKLCGAGGSGFVLILAKPENMESITSQFSESNLVRPKLFPKGVDTFEF